jgi:HEAT repeat protein
MLLVGMTGVASAIITACQTTDSVGTESWTSRDGRTPADPLATMEPNFTPAAAPATTMSIDALHTAALDELLAAADSNDPLLLANTIEAMKPYAEGIRPVVRRGLVADNRGVRFVAAMVAGQLKLHETTDLLEPLLLDEHDSVRAAAMYAKKQLGEKVDLSPLAVMLESNSAEVKGNAAYVLGELGEASAVPMLSQAMGKGLLRESGTRARIVDMQIAEAMVKLGAEDRLAGIRASLFAPAEQAEIIALACQICGNLDDRTAAPDLHNLALRTSDRMMPPEVRMSAALALAKMDAMKLSPWTVPMEYWQDERPELRAQAAVTLGAMGRRDVLPILESLLHDPDPLVRVASAGGILQIR